jgi:hypothetical protein
MLTLFRPSDLVRHRFDTAPYLDATVPGHRLARAVNALPPGGKVMALDFPCAYYFDRPWVAEGASRDPPLREWLEQGRDASGMLDELRALDVRYLLVTPGYGGGSEIALLPLASSVREAQELLALRARLRAVGHDADTFDLYEVPP